MKLRLSILLTLTGLLVAVGAIAVACGGDGNGELTLEEYFQQFDAINEDVDARINAVQDESPDAFLEAAATRDALSKIDAIIADGLARLDDMDPPDEVQEAHNEFRDGAAAQQEVLRKLVDELAGVESAGELAEGLEPSGPELDATVERLDAACLALEAVAADSGIDVDLECTEE